MKVFNKDSLCDYCGATRENFKTAAQFWNHYKTHDDLDLKIPCETTEAAHQHLNKRITKSNYHVKDIESKSQGFKLFKSVLHVNSYKIYI